MIDLNEIVMEAGRLDDDVDAVSIRYSGGCIHPGRSFYTMYIYYGSRAASWSYGISLSLLLSSPAQSLWMKQDKGNFEICFRDEI